MLQVAEIQGNTTQTIKHGESGTQVTAMPYDNYVFDRWSDGVTTASRTDTNVTSNLSVTAYFNYIEPEPEPDPEPIYKEATYSGGIGHRNQPQEASYEFDGDELYVRAKVISSKLKENYFAEGELEKAWLQPVRPGHE